MNCFAVTQAVSAVTAFTLLSVIIFHRPWKQVHIAFGLWLITLVLWTTFYFLWGIQTDKTSALFWMQTLMYPISFIHSSYFYFVLIFSNQYQTYRRHLRAACLASAAFFVIGAFNGWIDIDNVRSKGPFYFWPHGSALLFILIATEFYFVMLSFLILTKAIKSSSGASSFRLRLFLFSSVAAWVGGLTNWFSFYDRIQLLPVGNFLVTLYMIISAYLIFKHDILELNLVIKRSFVYALMALFITLTYTSFIILFEKISQAYFGYRSIVATILAALTIAVLFNPIKNLLNQFLEKLLFGKSLIELSNENLRMRDELRKQDQMKAIATMAAGMAHEIKNPLTSIKIFAEYLPEKFNDPDFRDKFKRIVADEVDRVNSIVQQLLNFSKPQLANKAEGSLVSVVEETLQLLSRNILLNKIELVKSFSEDIIISMDKNQIKQALLNIVINATQAMPDGGSLIIETSKDPNGFVLSIKDTGCGISKEALPSIFDPFFTTKETGTGLGLSIVHGIITQHGGKIKILSEEGKGTTVSVLLKNRN